MAQIFTKEWQGKYEYGKIQISLSLTKLIFKRRWNESIISIPNENIFYSDYKIRREQIAMEENIVHAWEEDSELDFSYIWISYLQSFLIEPPPITFFESITIDQATLKKIKSIKSIELEIFEQCEDDPCPPYILISVLREKYDYGLMRELHRVHYKIKQKFWQNILAMIIQHSARRD